MIQLIRRILNVSGEHKKRIQLAFVFSFLKSFLSRTPIMLAFFALAAFYHNTASLQMSIWLGIAMLACILLQVVFQYTSDRLQSASGYMVFAEKRMELGRHLRKMPMGYFTEGNMGKISSILSTDMVFIEENCMSELANMMSHIFSQAIMVVFMLFFNVYLGITAIVFILVVLLIARGMRKEALHDSAIRQEQSEKLTDAVLDFTEGIGIIKTYNLLGEKSAQLSRNFEESCRKSLEFEMEHAPWQRRLNLVYGLGASGIVTLSILLQSKGLLEITYLVGMLLFVLDFFGPLKALYSGIARLTVMNSCMDRIEEVFMEQQLPDNGTETVPKNSKESEIAFENVSFAYGEQEVLHNISFSLEKNQMFALVGPSGGGKSTIASLLTRFWDVKSGQILIRGKDIRDIPLNELMNHISMVFQRVYLFEDTIYNNIIMGRPNATKEEVIEASQKARCYDFVMALPEGFDTVIGEGGATLSGGEKQRLSIARCILKDAPIVILDEATASVDADNERYIQEAITELCKGKTLLVIAHRLNTIAHADKILVIKDGTIVEAGNHGELMSKGGVYKKFVTVRQTSHGWSRQKITTQI